jgi:hypothetical protein
MIQEGEALFQENRAEGPENSCCATVQNPCEIHWYCPLVVVIHSLLRSEPRLDAIIAYNLAGENGCKISVFFFKPPGLKRRGKFPGRRRKTPGQMSGE